MPGAPPVAAPMKTFVPKSVSVASAPDSMANALSRQTVDATTTLETETAVAPRTTMRTRFE